MNRIYVTGLVGALFLLNGCLQGDERLQEKAELESKAGAKKQVEVENENLKTKADVMENDLAIRHRFYQAIKGTYEGDFLVNSQKYRLRIVLVPSLAPYAVKRVRSLDEISSDLKNLFFNVHIVQWNPENQLSAVSCRAEQIRPDLVHGEIGVVSSSCSNSYQIQLSEAEVFPDQSSAEKMAVSSGVAREIFSGKLDKVSELRGKIQPGTSAMVYEFLAKRLED
jgi:hypothetical protein